MKNLALLSIWLALPLAIAGCGYHSTVSVYGKSGAVFTAPSLCGALVACINSPETSCFYDRNLIQTTSGTNDPGVRGDWDVSSCKEVKK